MSEADDRIRAIEVDLANEAAARTSSAEWAERCGNAAAALHNLIRGTIQQTKAGRIRCRICDLVSHDEKQMHHKSDCPVVDAVATVTLLRREVEDAERPV
jgi:hypothetical protein